MSIFILTPGECRIFVRRRGNLIVIIIVIISTLLFVQSFQIHFSAPSLPLLHRDRATENVRQTFPARRHLPRLAQMEALQWHLDKWWVDIYPRKLSFTIINDLIIFHCIVCVCTPPCRQRIHLSKPREWHIRVQRWIARNQNTDGQLLICKYSAPPAFVSVDVSQPLNEKFSSKTFHTAIKNSFEFPFSGGKLIKTSDW